MALSDNLVSYWKLDESSGNAADSHGSNTLTNNNTTPFVAAQLNNGADLEQGSGHYFSIADGSQTGLEPTGDMSINMWVKFEAFPVVRVGLLSKDHSGSSISYWFAYDPANHFLNYGKSPDGSTFHSTVVSWTASTATWYMLTVTKSSTSVKYYVNGAQQGTTQTLTNATMHNGTDTFRLGHYSTDTTFSMDGVMDEVGFWDKALSDAEITSLYNSGTPLAYPFATDVTVSATVLAATFSIPAYTVSTVQNVTVSPSVLTLTASLPAASVSTGATVTASPLSATFSIPAYDIITPDVIVTASVLTLTSSIPSYAIVTDQVLTMSPLSATFSLPAMTVTTVQHVTLTPSPFTATFTLLTPTRIGGLWTNQSRSAAATMTNQSRVSTSWANQERSES